MTRNTLHPEHVLEQRLTSYARELFENGMVFVILDDETEEYQLMRTCEDMMTVRRVETVGPFKAGETYLRNELRKIVARY